MRRFKALTAAIAIISLVSALCVGTAQADVSTLYSDGPTPTSTSVLDLGNVCRGTTVSKNVLLAVARSGQGDGQIYKDGSTVTFSVVGSGAVIPATTPVQAPDVAPGSTITLPRDWSSRQSGTSTQVSSTVTVSVLPAESGSITRSVTYQASGVNNNQNSNSLVRDVTLSVRANVVPCDTTPPTLQLPTNLTAEATGPNGAVVSWTATATDTAPANPAVTCSPTSGSTFAIGTTTVTCSATDDARNTATASFSVLVTDRTGPVITGTPSGVIAEATSGSGAIVTYPTPTATDAVDGARPVTCTPASGSTFGFGSTVVGCSSTDSRGNSSSSSFIVAIGDTTDPVLSLPGNLDAEATSADGAAVGYTVSALDAVDGAVTPRCSFASGSQFPLGTTTVECTAADRQGNTSDGSFTVTVRDTTAPELDLPTVPVAQATGPGGAAVSYDVKATDAVDDDVDVECAPASGSTYPIGATTVECTATDDAGRVGTGSFTVNVVDTVGPALSLPEDMTFEADQLGGRSVPFTASADDLVSGASAVTCNPASGTAFRVGVTAVDCEATDARGNKSTGSFTVTITDDTAPSVAVPDDMIVEATGPDGATAEFTASATDIADGDVDVTCDPASGSTFDLGMTTVTCSATDEAGNKGSNSFDVEVVDTTEPVIADTPADMTAEAAGPDGASVTYETPTASDVVDGDVDVTCDPASPALVPLDVPTTVTCRAVDAAGNPATSAFTITVSDTEAPVLVVPDQVTAEATGPDGAAVEFQTSATDTVDGELTPVCVPPSGSTFDLGDTTVTCEVADAHENPATKAFTVSVVDTTSPVLTLPDDIIAEATSAAGAAVRFEVSASDLVSGSTEVVCEDAAGTMVESGSTFPLATTEVTCTTVDGAGNDTANEFSVTVRDTTGPTLTLPADQTVEATGPNGASAAYTASASDVVDPAVPVSCSPISGSTLQLGATTVQCTATDDAGNTASGSFTVTVVDTTAPAVTVPGPITEEATGPNGATVTFATSAIDIVDGSPAVTCTPSSGSTFAIATTRVECSATDAAGNTGQASFDVTVEDTVGPAIASVPADQVAEATGADGAVVRYTDPTATDLVDGERPVTCRPPSGSTFALDEATTVTCTAIDTRGNESTQTFTISVSDTTAPALILPADQTVEATRADGAAVTYAASASDDVDGALAPACTPESGSTLALGRHTVRCEASDAHGNDASGEFSVTVVDTTAPALSLPAAITAEATGPDGATVAYLASANDVVDGAVDVTCSSAPGSTFALGTTTVSCSATDAAGNSAPGSFTVTVRDTTAPTLSLPEAQTVKATGADGAPVTFTATATDAVSGSRPVTCIPASGTTFGPGTTTASCSASDAAGNGAAGSFTVTVVFDTGAGFLQPVNPVALNTLKAGSTVPLKWQLPLAGGGYVSSLAVVASTTVAQISCATNSELPDPVEYTTTGGTSLRYDTTANQYVQNWQTPKKAGNCYRVDVRLVGGQVISAKFQLK